MNYTHCNNIKLYKLSLCLCRNINSNQFILLLGLDFYVGLPLSENWRCSRAIPQGLSGLIKELYDHPKMLGVFRLIFDPDSMFWKSVKNPSEIGVRKLYLHTYDSNIHMYVHVHIKMCNNAFAISRLII